MAVDPQVNSDCDLCWLTVRSRKLAVLWEEDTTVACEMLIHLEYGNFYIGYLYLKRQKHFDELILMRQ